MTTIDEQLDMHFNTWLRILETKPHPGASPPAKPGTKPDDGATRYGEWHGADGRTHAVRMTQPEWVLNQIDLLHSLEDHLTNDDVVVVAAPYELSLQGASLERAVEWMGASLISVGTSNTICPLPRLLDLIHRYQVTALVCEPQLAAELAALDQAAGRDPSQSSVTTLIFTRPTAPERLLRLATAWGACATEIFSTPLRPATAARCNSGRNHLFDARLQAQLHAPTPGRIAADGTRGELVLADLTADHAPRPTGELVELPPRDTLCACGSDSQIIIPLGKVADAINTPHGLVTQVDVEYCLFVSPYLQGSVATHVDGDRMSVTCAVRNSPEGHHPALRKLVRSLLGPSVDLTFLDDDIAEVDTSTRSS